MPDPMTDAELAAIRERLINATLGPWSLRGGDYNHGYVWLIDVNAPNPVEVRQRNNADFIVHCPVDVARLLDEVERLRAENADLRHDLATAREDMAAKDKDISDYERWVKSAQERGFDI